MYSSDTSWIMTVAYSCLITIQTNTATLIHIAKETQKNMNGHQTLLLLSFFSHLQKLQASIKYTYILAVFLQIPLTVPLEIHQIFR